MPTPDDEHAGDPDADARDATRRADAEPTTEASDRTPGGATSGGAERGPDDVLAAELLAALRAVMRALQDRGAGDAPRADGPRRVRWRRHS